LLFFGDSLLAGVGDPTGLGWVGRIVARSYALGVPLTAYNLGVRGDTSPRIAARWRGELEPRLLAEAETRVVLSFGVNDTTVHDAQSTVAADRSQQALRAILDEAAMIGLPALVVGPAPIDDPEQNRRIADLSRSFAEICTARGTPFVDVFELLLDSGVWMAQVSAGDGAHPSAEGYEVLAQLVASGGLLDWLERAH
jgi:lysophospholipase L1-like esterase